MTSRPLKRVGLGKLTEATTATTGWPSVPLQDCIEPASPICYGILMPGAHDPNGIPVVKVKNLIRGSVKPENVLYASREIESRYARSRLLAGDILISIRGTTGTIAAVPIELARANITQDTARLRVRSGVDRRFVFHALTSSQVQRYISYHTVGQAVKGINIRDVRRIPVPLPPLETQSAIAGAVDAWQASLDAIEADLEAKRRFKRGLMQELLTERRRFPQFDGAWVTTEMANCLEEVSRPIVWSDADTYELLSVKRRSGGVFRRGQLRGNQIATKKLFEANTDDVLISKMQAVHGAIGIVKPEHHGMKVSGSYIVLRPKSGAPITPAYFAWLTRMPLMYRAVLLASYGVHIEKMTFNLEWYLRTCIRIPPTIKEQEAITDLMDSLEQEEQLLIALERSLARQKQAILEKLLSGELRLPA